VQRQAHTECRGRLSTKNIKRKKNLKNNTGAGTGRV
jgi:hypothetical protein